MATYHTHFIDVWNIYVGWCGYLRITMIINTGHT